MKPLEPYSAVAARLRTQTSDSRKMRILVTSANPGEGVSTTVACLGAALACDGSVLLVDANIDNPDLQNCLDSDAQDDNSSSTSDEAVRKNVADNTDLLVARDLMASSDSKLASGKLLDAMERISDDYQFALIDGPPVLSSPDMTELARHANGVVLVIAADETRYEVVLKAIETIEMAGGCVLGSILNRTPRYIPDFVYRMI
ncbi:CpsD/CapB family tyrosine-protein kinase [Candidatus Hydrogenedentota bacterium]